jgi:diaminobutyrate-2-oxoglutarate transaminase
MWGVELADPVTRAPASELASRVRAHALRHGLIIELGGRGDAVVRLLPPLNITAAQVEEALALLSAAFADAMQAGDAVQAGAGTRAAA